ncbi:MAG: TrkA family potassium uptake protein [Clostridia bacterium]
MNILVVGGGYLGRSVAEELDNLNHEVAVIEEDEEKLNHLSPEFGGVSFCSFPMDINNLISAGIENCDAVLVTSSDDNLNITIGQIARKIFNVPKVVSRISDPARENVFETFGLQTVCPTNISSYSMISAVLQDKELEKINIETNTIAFNLTPINRKLIGHTAKDISVDSGVTVLGLLKTNKKIVLNSPSNSPKIEDGDYIVYAKLMD